MFYEFHLHVVKIISQEKILRNTYNSKDGFCQNKPIAVTLHSISFMYTYETSLPLLHTDTLSVKLIIKLLQFHE